MAKILVVDDNAMNRDLLSRHLAVFDYEVATAADGYEALEHLEAHPCDLVLLDITMPRIDGVAVLRVIREQRSRRSLPVIMTTAKTASEDVVEAMNAGANDYVTKPIDFPVLRARLEAQLSMKEDAPVEKPADCLSAECLAPGSVVDGRYEILEAVGRGGFSVVYAARQTSTGQKVAIKLVRPDASEERRATEIARIRREMEIIALLNHPNIVRLIDAGSLDDGVTFLVLEYVEGRSLREVLERHGTLDPADAKHLMLGVLDALSCAHTAGVVHLDLKPENIMIVETGYRPNAMVLDFGLSLPHGAGTDDRPPLSGSPAYMAPEMIRRNAPAPTMDLYAWGLVYLECLTGSIAVRRSSVSATLLVHLQEDDIEVPACVLPEVAVVIAKATAKSVRRRYSSAAEALTALERVDAEVTVEVDPRDIPPPEPGCGSETRRVGT